MYCHEAARCRTINNALSQTLGDDAEIILKRFENTSKLRCQGYRNKCHEGTISGLSLAVIVLSIFEAGK